MAACDVELQASFSAELQGYFFLLIPKTVVGKRKLETSFQTWSGLLTNGETGWYKVLSSLTPEDNKRATLDTIDQLISYHFHQDAHLMPWLKAVVKQPLLLNHLRERHPAVYHLMVRPIYTGDASDSYSSTISAAGAVASARTVEQNAPPHTSIESLERATRGWDDSIINQFNSLATRISDLESRVEKLSNTLHSISSRPLSLENRKQEIDETSRHAIKQEMFRDLFKSLESQARQAGLIRFGSTDEVASSILEKQPVIFKAEKSFRKLHGQLPISSSLVFNQYINHIELIKSQSVSKNHGTSVVGDGAGLAALLIELIQSKSNQKIEDSISFLQSPYNPIKDLALLTKSLPVDDLDQKYKAGSEFAQACGYDFFIPKRGERPDYQSVDVEGERNVPAYARGMIAEVHSPGIRTFETGEVVQKASVFIAV